MTYVFYSKLDSNCEIIGRVIATSLNEARTLISGTKKLAENVIDDLFVIKKLDDYENNI
jgi:hypothetical protein